MASEERDTSPSEKSLKPNFFDFLRHVGVQATLRHYRRLILNALFRTATKDVGLTFRLASAVPASLGLLAGWLLCSIQPRDIWWNGLLITMGAAIAVIGCAFTVALSFVHLMFFRHVAGMLIWCAGRMLVVAAVMTAAGIWCESLPQRTAVVVLAAAAYFLCLPLLQRLYHLVLWHRAQPALRKKISWSPKKLTEDQIWRIAVHEAGHAVAYGLLKTLPEDACAGISAERASTIGGYAWGLWMSDFIEFTDALLDMVLIQLAAGTIAEEIILGDRCFGDSDDMAKFDQLMRNRVVHFAEQGYNTAPADDVQRAWNLRLERRHRLWIHARVRELVELNKAAIVSLAQELQTREFIDCLELVPFWTAIMLPPTLTRIDVPSSVPCLTAEQIAAHRQQASSA